MIKSLLPVLSVSLIGIGSLSAEEAAGPKDAATNWQQHCQKCHGADGSGSTRIGKRLKLRDYTDAAVQASFSDEEITKILNEGITDDRGREVKPSFADILSAEEIAEMVTYIRGMSKSE